MDTSAAIDDDVVERTSSTQSRSLTARRVGRVALALIIGQALFRGFAMRSGYFFEDDFIILYNSSKTSLSGDFIFQGYNGHLGPAAVLLIWTLQWIAPMSFTLVTVVMVILQVIASWLVWLLIREFAGLRAGALIPLAVYLFSPLTLSSFFWYTAGVAAVPLQLVMAGSLLFHVRHLRTGIRADAVRSLLILAVGLMFSEKALLVLPVLAVVTLFWFSSGGPIRRTIRALADHRWLWLAHWCLAVSYLALYLWRVELPLGSSSGASSTLDLAKQAINSTFIPHLLGGPYSSLPSGVNLGPEVSTSMQIVFVELFVLVVITTIAAHWGAWKAWALLAGYLAIDIALLASGRGDAIGPVIGRNTRYVADASVVAVFALTIALFGSGGGSSSSSDSGSAQTPATVKRRRLDIPAFLDRPVVTGLILFGYLNSCMFTSVAMTQEWSATSAEPYVEAIQRDLQRLGDVVIYNSRPPAEVLHPWFLENDYVSHIVGSLPEEPRFDEPTDQFYVADASGRLQPAVLQVAIGSITGPDPCGWPVAPAATTVIDLDQPLFAGRWTVSISYVAAEAVPARVTIGEQTFAVDLEQGSSELFIVYVGPLASVSVSLGNDAPAVCINQVLVGQI